MINATITTNNVPRPVIYGYELTTKEQREFDYLGFSNGTAESECDGDCRTFFRYKGNVYDLGECLRVEGSDTLYKGWDGYFGESYFSAVVVKYCDNFESVIVGRITW